MSTHPENTMTTTSTPPVRPQTASAQIPEVPLTTEGYSVLHQMMRFRWTAWRALPEAARSAIAQEAASVLGEMEQNCWRAIRAFLADRPQGRSDAGALPQLVRRS